MRPRSRFWVFADRRPRRQHGDISVAAAIRLRCSTPPPRMCTWGESLWLRFKSTSGKTDPSFCRHSRSKLRIAKKTTQILEDTVTPEQLFLEPHLRCLFWANQHFFFFGLNTPSCVTLYQLHFVHFHKDICFGGELAVLS